MIQLKSYVSEQGNMGAASFMGAASLLHSFLFQIENVKLIFGCNVKFKIVEIFCFHLESKVNMGSFLIRDELNKIIAVICSQSSECWKIEIVGYFEMFGSQVLRDLK